MDVSERGSPGPGAPRVTRDAESAEQISMLRQEVARLGAALEQAESGSDAEIQKMRKANRVLEAHVDMLRNNLAAVRNESAEQTAKLADLSRTSSAAPGTAEPGDAMQALQAEVATLQTKNQVGLMHTNLC